MQGVRHVGVFREGPVRTPNTPDTSLRVSRLFHGDQPNLACHNDLAAWNLIIDRERLVFIDWDAAGPSTRLWDLAYAAISFGHLFAAEVVDVASRRLAAFIDGYDADDLLRAA